MQGPYGPQHLAEWWPSPTSESGLDITLALCRAPYVWGAMAATVPRNSIVWSWQVRLGGISGCPADGRLLPEQRGLCPPDSPSTPSLLDPTSFSLLCCPFSLVLRTPKTTQAANEILPETVARVTGLVLFSGDPLEPRPAPLLWLPPPSLSPLPLLWVVENDPNTLHFEPATAPLETRQVPNWLGHWCQHKGNWLMSHLGWVASGYSLVPILSTHPLWTRDPQGQAH